MKRISHAMCVHKDHFSSNDNSKMAQVLLTLRNWCSSQHAASQPPTNFIASNFLLSIKVFTALPSCCLLRRTLFSNLVHMCTCSLIPKPITIGMRLVDTWNHTLTITAGAISSRSCGKSSWAPPRCIYSYNTKYSFSNASQLLCQVSTVFCAVQLSCDWKQQISFTKGSKSGTLHQISAYYMLGTTTKLSMLF